jgi:hypothetical protein
MGRQSIQLAVHGSASLGTLEPYGLRLVRSSVDQACDDDGKDQAADRSGHVGRSRLIPFRLRNKVRV